MVDISSLETTVQASTGIVSFGILLVNPQKDRGIEAQLPAGTTGENAPDNFLFHYTGEDTASLMSETTDHYVEDNTTIQDQVALKPETITTQGFIGELNNVPPPALAKVKQVADKLTLLTPFTPALSASAIRAYNEAAQAYQTAALAKSTAVQAWNTLHGGATPVQTEQQKVFNKFYGYWKARQLFTVQTPWAIFTDMVILSLRATQTEETKMITDFEVTFKKMRFAKTLVVVPAGMQGRAAAQSSAPVDKGLSKPGATVDVKTQMEASGLK